MSAELNVKLVLDTSDIQNQLSGLQKKIGGSLSSTPANKASGNGKSGGVSISDAFTGMLRSLLMYRAIAEALKLLREAVMAVVGAFEKAKKLYVGGALSGFGTRMQTQRTAIAGILGVSEQDVLKFGEAYKYFNAHLKSSLDTIAKNARPLAETNMAWEMMKVDLEALASTIAMQTKPAIDGLISVLSVMAKTLNATVGYITEAFKKMLLNPILSKVLSKVFNLSLEGIKKLTDDGEKPTIAPQMKQLGSSAWEKMGLVIGGGGATNYAKDTAHNTKRANNLLETISRHLAAQQRGDNVFQSLPQTP